METERARVGSKIKGNIKEKAGTHLKVLSERYCEKKL